MEVKVLIQNARPENTFCVLRCDLRFVTTHMGSLSWTREHRVVTLLGDYDNVGGGGALGSSMTRMRVAKVVCWVLRVS